MVIVTYEVAFRSYSPFSKKLYLLGSTNIRIRVYIHLEKHTLQTTQDSYGFLTMLRLFALLYLIHLCALQTQELLCLNCIELFHCYVCY